MNTEENVSYKVDTFSRPEGVSVDDWYALDLNDPLMAVC